MGKFDGSDLTIFNSKNILLGTRLQKIIKLIFLKEKC